MFQKTKLKKSYLNAIGMSLVLLLVNTLGVLLGTGVGQIAPPSTDVWSNYTLAPTGSGTSESPYKVTKAEELAWFLNNGSSSYVTVENDIDLGAHS